MGLFHQWAAKGSSEARDFEPFVFSLAALFSCGEYVDIYVGLELCRKLRKTEICDHLFWPNIPHIRGKTGLRNFFWPNKSSFLVLGSEKNWYLSLRMWCPNALILGTDICLWLKTKTRPDIYVLEGTLPRVSESNCEIFCVQVLDSLVIPKFFLVSNKCC